MEKLNDEIEALVLNLGYKLYDVEMLKENGENIFRVSIASQNGINHDDCKKVSEAISPLLDVYPPFENKYSLEVSSPGIERKLKNPNHFQLSLNERIKIVLLNGEKIIGILKDATMDGFYIDSNYYQYKDVKKAKIIFE